ncbi:ribonuclease T2, partial [Aureobasidium melanogenum]
MITLTWNTGSGLVVSRTTAANVGQSTVASGKGILELTDRVCGSVARLDAGVVQPSPGRKTTVVKDGGLEELDDFLVLDVFGAVARHKSLVSCQQKIDHEGASKIPVRGALVDPVLVHPGEKVVFAKRLEESANIGTLVRRDNSAIGQAIGSVGRRCRIVLSVQVAVLGVRAIAEVRPQAVQRPLVGRQQLTLGLEASHESTVLGLAALEQDRTAVAMAHGILTDLASVVQVTLTRIQDSECRIVRQGSVQRMIGSKPLHRHKLEGRHDILASSSIKPGRETKSRCCRSTAELTPSITSTTTWSSLLCGACAMLGRLQLTFQQAHVGRSIGPLNFRREKTRQASQSQMKKKRECQDISSARRNPNTCKPQHSRQIHHLPGKLPDHVRQAASPTPDNLGTTMLESKDCFYPIDTPIWKMSLAATRKCRVQQSDCGHADLFGSCHEARVEIVYKVEEKQCEIKDPTWKKPKRNNEKGKKSRKYTPSQSKVGRTSFREMMTPTRPGIDLYD